MKAAADEARVTWTPWRAVVAFGLVSLAADMVYEGMRAMAGPYLGSLGASAMTVGLVTGAGESVALVLRLATGPWADRSHRHWRLTVIGYAMTAVCGCHAPSGDSGTTSAQSRRMHCQTSKAPSSPTSSNGRTSRGARLPMRSHDGSARGSRTADPVISSAMASSLSPN